MEKTGKWWPGFHSGLRNPYSCDLDGSKTQFCCELFTNILNVYMQIDHQGETVDTCGTQAWDAAVLEGDTESRGKLEWLCTHPWPGRELWLWRIRPRWSRSAAAPPHTEHPPDGPCTHMLSLDLLENSWFVLFWSAVLGWRGWKVLKVLSSFNKEKRQISQISSVICKTLGRVKG